MELTTYETENAPTYVDELSGTEDNFYFAYYATNNVNSIRWKTNQISAASSHVDFWRIVEVKVMLDLDDSGYAKDSTGASTSYTEAETLAMLAAETTANNAYTVSVTRTSNAGRALFMEAEATETPDYVLSSGATAEASKTLATAKQLVAGDSTEGLYFLMYVDGTNATINTADSITGNFTVTTAAAHANY